MNVVDETIRNLKYNIPQELLEITFQDYSDVTHRNISLDEMIRSTIILGRVIRDCSRVEGIMTIIDLGQCTVAQVERGEYIIEVPMELTQGRRIVELLSLVSNAHYYAIGGIAPYGNSMLTYTTKMADNVGTVNVQQSTRMEIIGNNVIYLRDPMVVINRTALRCNVEYDDNMTNIAPAMIPVLNKLVVLATQSYIYNKMRINLDKGYIYAGYDLSVIRDIVDSYSDAEQMYQEYLRINFAIGGFSTQQEKMSRYIKSMLGNNM